MEIIYNMRDIFKNAFNYPKQINFVKIKNPNYNRDDLLKQYGKLLTDIETFLKQNTE